MGRIYVSGKQILPIRFMSNNHLVGAIVKIKDCKESTFHGLDKTELLKDVKAELDKREQLGRRCLISLFPNGLLLKDRRGYGEHHHMK